MPSRVAEHVVRGRLFRRPLRLRVDLHGVSVFGPGGEHHVMRWEWIEQIEAGDEVVVAGAGTELRLPAGAFGLSPGDLADRLRSACDLRRRPDVIGGLRGDADEG